MNALYLDHQVTRQHAIGAVIDTVATKVLTSGIISFYPCTDPTLDPKIGFYLHPVTLDCDECLVNDKDLKVLTSVPESWHVHVLFGSVGWYKPYSYVNQQMHGMFSKPYAKTYLSQAQKLASVPSNAVADVVGKLGFTLEITPKSDVNCDLAADHDGPLSLTRVPCWDKLEYDDGEEADNNDVCHCHCCSHEYECRQMISCHWNEITYPQKIPCPSKSYNLEGGIRTKIPSQYQAENATSVPSDGTAVDAT